VLAYSVYPKLAAGQTVLVHAGAGGVSHLLIQMMKRLGVRVLTTVSSDEKAWLAREAGADEVIIYTREDFEEATKRLTDGRGVHVVFDGVGKDTFEKSMNCLRPTGYLVMFGESSGPPPAFLPATLGPKGSIFLTRVLSSNFNENDEERLQRVHDVFRWVLEGELKVHVHKAYPFSEAAAAQQELESRRSAGKILITL
jgi:NADPH2:quinone reductase